MSSLAVSSDQKCPCGSGQVFGECCQPIISRQIKAPTAERLMRSRYTAHVIDDEAWLHHSYWVTTKKPFKPAENGNPFTWVRLEVHSHEAGANENQAFVEFSAYFKDGEDAEQVLQERSEFKRVDGEWYYAKLVRSGPPPKRAVGPKVGRNDPCPCGSGKKFKSCCLV